MNIIAVDDERPALATLKKAIEEVRPGAQVSCFRSAREALQYAEQNRVDVAFLDIRMAEMNGLVLAKHLKELCASTNIIFVTGYNSYMGNAFEMHASGYVMKPIDSERVAQELDNLRAPRPLPGQGVRVQCFGNFEIFVDGKPVPFGRERSKEILAYLVDREGASVSTKELAGILWEDEPYDRSKQKQLNVYIGEMQRSLRAVGAADIIISGHGHYAVDTTRFTCDFYEYTKGNAAAVNSYAQEYMTTYSWAEFTAGRLFALE